MISGRAQSIDKQPTEHCFESTSSRCWFRSAAKTVGMTAIRYQLDKGDDLAALLAGAGVRPRA